jgi:RHS repeat-associated protein
MEGSQAYSWDDNGNLASKAGEATYTFDVENRLIKVIRGGLIVEHAYDVDGNRVQTKMTSEGATATANFLVDTSGSLSHVVAETSSASTLQAIYIRGGDELAELVRPVGASTSTRFYCADGVGSIRVLTNEAGAIADRYTYSGFGELLQHAGTDPQPYTFAGEPYDVNTGFAHHRARWMHSKTGTFIGMDPFSGDIDDPMSLHRYLYAAADPANNIDPSGRSLMELGVAVAIASIVAAIAISSYRASILSPGYTVLEDRIISNAGGFTKRYRSQIVAPDASTRFLIVQWIKGDFKIDGQYAKLSLAHRGNLDQEMFWVDYVTDSPTRLRPEYPGLSKGASSIELRDEPGIKGSLPSGTVLEANLDFIVAVYDLNTSPSTLKSPFSPQPLLWRGWDFKGSYTVP